MFSDLDLVQFASKNKKEKKKKKKKNDRFASMINNKITRDPLFHSIQKYRFPLNIREGQGHPIYNKRKKIVEVNPFVSEIFVQLTSHLKEEFPSPR